MKDRAIHCNRSVGPSFGNSGDLSIGGYADMENGNHSYGFGRNYTNDTGMGGNPGQSTFLAGTKYFAVKEIEVFEITD
jgi:hypothetical protein